MRVCVCVCVSVCVYAQALIQGPVKCLMTTGRIKIKDWFFFLQDDIFFKCCRRQNSEYRRSIGLYIFVTLTLLENNDTAVDLYLL